MTKISYFYEVNKKYLRPLIFCLVFGALGVITLLLTQAASTDYSIEPETGTLSGGASIVTDLNASGGQGIKFQTPGTYTWKPLKIGAGGFNTGIDQSPDGSTLVIRTDTYGAYRWAGTAWKQLVTAQSMPSEDVKTDGHDGVYEIAIAPSNPNRFFMVYAGYIYRSDDKGDSWAKTAFVQHSLSANDGPRTNGKKMVVDPINPDVAYVGTATDGVYYTVNAGISWQKISTSSIASSTRSDSGAYTGMAFDPSGGSLSGKTRTLYIAAAGRGVYKTSDAGASWQLLTGSPTSVDRAKIASDGTYYAATSTNPGLLSYKSGVWKNISPDGSSAWHSIAVDPSNPNRIFAADQGGNTAQSTDGGTTWKLVYTWDTANYKRLAIDIPWLAWTEESWMSNGDMIFDATTPNKIWFAEGIGTWYATVAAGASSITWNSQSSGIEQLVVNEIIAPPSGKPVVSVWDRAQFYISNPDVYAAMHQPSSRFNSTWGLDWSLQDPKFLVSNTSDMRGCCQDAHSIDAGYSTDGGLTWTRFASIPLNATNPYTYGFGSIAVSTPDNIVWSPSQSGLPYYTKNRGATWQPVNLPGLDTNNPAHMSGFNNAYYLNRHNIAADKSTVGTFYLYNSALGLYRTTDGGSTWVLIHSGEIVQWSAFNVKLKAVPGKAGELYYTNGEQSGGPTGAFAHSTDGGVTWTMVPNVLEVHTFGFGKAAPGKTSPAVYICGWVNNIYGIYRSDDNAATWTKIGDYPLGSLDAVTTIDGDKDVYGKVYLGFSGSGAAYGYIQ